MSKDNPRQNFDEEGLRRLGESMKGHGQLQAILVRPKGNQYELVIGERRFRASKLVGLTEIEATVHNLDDSTCMEFRLIENTEREDLTDAEKGNAVDNLLTKYPEKYPTIGFLAGKLQKDRITVGRWLEKAERLSDYVVKCISRDTLSDRTATLLLPFSREVQNKLAKAIIDYKIKSGHDVDLHREFIKQYALHSEKYPSVESLEDLANEVKGIKKVKIDLDKLSPRARSEVERKLKEAEEEAKALKKTTPWPRVSHRPQGRPRGKKKTVIAESKAEEKQLVSEPIIDTNITTIAVTINLPETLWEKIHRYNPSKLLEEIVVELLESHPALRTS